jgi:hypothetical protein
MDWLTQVVSAAVSIAAIVTGAVIARGNRRGAALQHAAESAEAHRVWHRDRRADAYLEFLYMADTVSAVIASAHPLIDSDPPRSLPALPNPEAQSESRVRLGAFAPPAIRQKADVWRGLATGALKEVEAVGRGDEGARPRLDKLRADQYRALVDLTDAIADDLAPPPTRGWRRTHDGHGRPWTGVADEG